MDEQTRPEPVSEPFPVLRIWLCGTFEMQWTDALTGRAFPALARKSPERDQAAAVTLLALLLCQPGRQAHRDWVMEQFWPEGRREVAVHRLENIVSCLRKLLRPPWGGESMLYSIMGKKTGGASYAVDAYPAVWVDLDALTWHMEQACRLERFGDDALPMWERAFALLKRGPLLAHHAYDAYADWVMERRAQQDGMLRHCVHALARLYVRHQGEAGKNEALLVLGTYWQQHKTDEDALRPLMELLGEQERYQEAEQYYQECIAALAEEDAEGQPREPDARTRDIREYLRTKQIQRERVHSGKSASARFFSPSPTEDIIEAERMGERQPMLLQSSFCQGTIVPHTIESDNEPVKRREATRTIAAFSLQILGLPVLEQFIQSLTSTSSFHTETLVHLEQLSDVCWRLANDSQKMIVAQILPTFLPQLTLLAGQPSPHQQQVARLATRGYILAAEVEKKNIAAMQAYCDSAIIYSEIADDNTLKADALRQKATIALIAKEPSNAVRTYQQALTLANTASPLLQSRIYLGAGSALARVGQKQAALRYLGLARDSYPDHPEDDPAFLYLATSSDRAALYLYEALTYSDLQQPENALNVLMRGDGMQPKIPMVESTRIEFLNLQAKTAAVSGNMEQSLEYLGASVKVAKKSGYVIWVQEAYDVYLTLCQTWPHEKSVKSLAQLFQ